jgi:phosphatidylglycerophosphatase A
MGPISRLHPAVMLATWFWSGLSPVAPGTVGSLAALPAGVALYYAGGPQLLGLSAIIVFGLGIWATHHYLQATGRSDPGEVVIDEVAGQWIPLLAAGLDPLSIAVAFALFRLFDIWKPWPIRWLDHNIKGATGVMVDDVLAGIFALAGVLLLHEVLS